jgi:glycosyltransferase involved in cell wall biosynthesis
LKLGICAFPLSRGLETGRGLERVVSEICGYLDEESVGYNFYDRGLIRNEAVAIIKSIAYFFHLLFTKDDVYFGVYPVAGLFPILAGKKKVVTAVHDLIPFNVFGYDNQLKYAIKRLCIKFACRHSAHVIVPFLSTKMEIVKLFGVNPDKVSVFPYGVNHATYYVDETVQKQDGKICFLGEAKRAKGMDTAILAFKEVQGQFENAKLILASNGNEIEEMR